MLNLPIDYSDEHEPIKVMDDTTRTHCVHSALNGGCRYISRAEAIHHQAAAYGGNDLTVLVTTAEHLPPLPAAIEVAAYRIILEALTNVVRHAHARNCQIQLAIETVPEEQALIVEVADDGRGLFVESQDGIGIRSMHERAIEVGGSVAVEGRAPTGTRVHARIPIPSKGAR